MSLSSQLCVEDMGALFLGPSTLMADPFGPLLDEDEESALSEGSSSPLSFSSYSESYTSSPFSSPLAPSSLGCKVGCDVAPLPWLSEQMDAHTGADQKEGDAFSGMDWMTEKIDLSDFDLDSLIGSCDLDEPPSSPEELLASLNSQMDLEMNPLPFPSTSTSHTEELDVPAHTLDLPLPDEQPEDLEMQAEPVTVDIKSEPASPPPALAPLSPAFTLEVGSEVDISELEKAVSKTGGDHQTPSLVLSLSPAHILVVLAPKEEVSILASACADQADSGVESISGSPPHCPSPAPSPKPVGTSRTKPYSKTDSAAGPAVGGRVKTSGAPKMVDKKLKKMEQNKTAATRYRQKKRVEQESLNVECAELENRNRELQEKADSISREIQYLKDLMEEVRSAKTRKTKTKVNSR
ncbi:cyclic AMP-dependent transcription factor ATF-4 [Brachyhypopomus gauderio]|uniref:cyclic AMP-dependent transcription factor ATF-4 n=1 Tax=Brachyhypopomus gauderio TaxID=698409 RepID=UPI00404108EF